MTIKVLFTYDSRFISFMRVKDKIMQCFTFDRKMFVNIVQKSLFRIRACSLSDANRERFCRIIVKERIPYYIIRAEQNGSHR